MITTCILTYNNESTIAKTIVSAAKYSNRIIIVDGAYKDFEQDKPYSTDATIDVAKGYTGVEVVTTERCYDTEAEKRNIYLDLLNNGDLFLSLDSNEVLEDLDVDRIDDKDLISYLKIELPNRQISAPRIIRYKQSMSYQTHDILSQQGEYHNLKDTQVSLETVGHITQQNAHQTDAYRKWKAKQKQQEQSVKDELQRKGVQLI